VIDAESADLLMMAKDRGSEALGEFAAAMAEHGAKPEQITEIVMDMSPAYIAGAMEHFPGARVVFDAFHIMSRPQEDRQPKAVRRVRRSRINMASQALDKVRKDLARQGANLRGGLWALRGNAWTRNGEQQQRRAQLMAAYPALGRAVVLRELLQDALASGERAQLAGWLAWAERSRLASLPRSGANPQTSSRRRLGLHGNQTDQRPHGSCQRFAATSQTHRPRVPQLPLLPTRRLPQSWRSQSSNPTALTHLKRRRAPI